MLWSNSAAVGHRVIGEWGQEMKENCTYQLLVYTDDVNLLGDIIGTIKKNKETLIDANKEVALEVNAEKCRYMLLSRQQNSGKYDIKIANQSFENVAELKKFGNPKRIKIFFSIQVRADRIWVMLATIQSTSFCLLVCCLKT
jgi:hypothetical protein